MIISLVTSPKYTSMQKAYEEHPVTREEARLVAAYLEYVGTRTRYQQEQNKRAAELLNRLNHNIQH